MYMYKITVKQRKICLVIISRILTKTEKMKKNVDRGTCGLSAQVMRLGTGAPPKKARPGRDLLPWEQDLDVTYSHGSRT